MACSRFTLQFALVLVVALVAVLLPAIPVSAADLTVQVQAPDGSPAGEVYVDVYDASGYVDGGYGSSGEVALVLGDGDYEFVASDAGATTYGKSERVAVSVSGGVASPDPVVLRLRLPNVTAQVLAPDGSPAGEVFVSVHDASGSQVDYGHGSSGEVTFALDDGNYELVASDNQWSKQYESSVRVAVSVSGGVASPDPVVLRLRLPNVTAQVLAPDGSPAGEVNVHVYDASGDWVDGDYGSSGEVTFALEDGDYEFVAFDGSWPPPYLPSERVSVSVSGGVASPDPVVLRLRAPNVTAQVLAPDGSPAGEVYVDVYDASGSQVDNDYGSAGEVTFLLEDGDYELVASDGQWPKQFESSQRVLVSVSGGVASPDPVVLGLRAPTVTAQVLAPDGSPAGEVYVDVYDASGSQVDSGYGSAGEVTFLLEDGDYELVASDGQWPKQFESSQRVLVSVSGGVASPDPVVLGLRAPNVTAQVLAPDGSPAGEVYVRVYDASGSQVDSGYGSSGEVTFLLEDGDYELVASDDNWPKQFGESVRVAVSVSGGVASPDPVVLGLRAPTVTAQVLAPDGSPAGEVYVRVYDASGGWVDSGYGSAGEVTFLLEDGDYELVASDDNWPKQYAESVRVLVSVSGGVASPDPVVLGLRAPNVTAQVLAPDGSPAGEVYVRVYDASGSQVDSGYGSSGEVTFLLEDGDYELVASDGQWPKQFGESVRVAVSVSGGVASPDPVVLGLRAPNVTAQVQTPGGSPAGEVYVRVYDASGGWVDSGYGSSGEVTFLLEDGDYELVASDDNWPKQYAESVRVAVSVSGGVASPDPVTLSLRELNIVGEVLAPGGGPAEDVCVYAFPSATKLGDEDRAAMGCSASDGSFRMFLEDGTYWLQAKPYSNDVGYASSLLQVTVAEGVADVEGPTLTLHADPNLTGTVDTAGADPSDVKWTVYRRESRNAYDDLVEVESGHLGSTPLAVWLADGDFVVQAMSYLWSSADVASSTLSAVQVTGGTADPATVAVALRPAGTVNGAVVDNATGEAPDACVQVYQYEDGARTATSTKLANDGSYELKLGEGPQTLGVGACTSRLAGVADSYAEEYVWDLQWFGGSSTLEGASPVEVAAGGTSIANFSLGDAPDPEPLGKPELLSFHPSNGTWWQTEVAADGTPTTSLLTKYRTASGWQTHLAADMTGDGKPELLSFHPSNGTWWQTEVAADGTPTTSLLTKYRTASGWQTHLAADMTGDGKPELLSFHPSNGTWWQTEVAADGTPTTSLLTKYRTASGWQTHLAADMTGDGKPELLSFHPSNGTWWQTEVAADGTPTTSLLTKYRTASGWQTHLAADMTGDGKPELLSFHPSNGTWWQTEVAADGTPTTSLLTKYRTASGWQTHLAADMTGDGKPELLSFHPSNGTWWQTEVAADGTPTTSLLTKYRTASGWQTHLAADMTGG